MTVEADIYTALKSLVGNRVYPDIAPINAARPYITYSQIGGAVVTFLEKAVASKKNGRFQFDVWADTRASCASVALQVEAALMTSALFEAEPIGAQESAYDYDMALYRSMQDFSVWSSR